MQGEYAKPINMTQNMDYEGLEFKMVLNAMKEIVWVNGKAAAFLQSVLCIERHLDPSSIDEWHNYLKKVRDSTVKKMSISLLTKKKELMHFIAYGIYVHWNETYIIHFRPVANPFSVIELYDKTFQMLDETQIGACIAGVNGFIFSANDTANFIVPNVGQMSIVELFRRFFNTEQLGYYIKLLNERENFSTDVFCYLTNKNYHLMYRFDREFKVHFIMMQPLFLQEITINHMESSNNNYLDKETAASIVHEIRNPLTVLQGFVDLMVQDTSKNEQYIQLLGNEIRRMEHLLGGMLQLLKPTAKSEPIEFNSFMKKIILLFEMDVKNKNICLVYGQSSEQCYILGNEYALTQVFINIIKNSIQAMDSNGVITVTFNRTENKELEICIKDTGSGMSEVQLANLFIPYYTTKEYGTGLGLPVVKKLLEDMGGRIDIRSELGKGTEVFIYLQLASECNCNLIN